MTKDEELKHMRDNLTATQERCNQLLEEARAARREVLVARVTEGALRLRLFHVAQELEALRSE